jgi:hypothetical protein
MIETDRSRSDIERASIGVDYFQLLDFLISMKVDKTNAFDLRGNPYEDLLKQVVRRKTCFLRPGKEPFSKLNPLRRG